MFKLFCSIRVLDKFLHSKIFFPPFFISCRTVKYNNINAKTFNKKSAILPVKKLKLYLENFLLFTARDYCMVKKISRCAGTCPEHVLSGSGSVMMFLTL
jgi:hypothetical protein